MEIKVNSGQLESTSASKKAQANAKALFGSKGVSILSKLEEYMKEKLLLTPGVADLVRLLSKGTPEQIEKYKKLAAGKKAITASKKLASAKTLSAVTSALKEIRVPDSVLPPMTAKGPAAKPAKAKPAKATEAFTS